MKKAAFVAGAILVLGSALDASASDQPKKPSSSQTTASQQAKLGIQTPFNVWPDDQYIFVVNNGSSDWKTALDVHATCIPVAPATTCGPSFPGGKFHKHFATFPKGHGNAPVKGSGNAQQISGAGWIAVFMGLPVGSYKITATAANNSSPETDVTISPATPPGGTIQVNHGGLQVAPTKTP